MVFSALFLSMLIRPFSAVFVSEAAATTAESSEFCRVFLA